MKFTTLKHVIASALVSLSLLVSATASSGVAVIVHPGNGNTMAADDVARIFLGKKKSFPDGSEAIPIDQNEGSATRSSFVSTVLKKNGQQIKAYWAQMLFTGKGTPPKAVNSASDVKKLVSENPNLIGYIDSSEVDDSVKVVGEF